MELEILKNENEQLKSQLKTAIDKAKEMMILCFNSEEKHNFILNRYNDLKKKPDDELNEKESVLLEMITIINDLIKYKEEKEEIDLINAHIKQVIDQYITNKNILNVDESNEAFKDNRNNNFSKICTLINEACSCVIHDKSK
jgi:hypothetical protein